jgi:MPBQ/MSBQ methyltransferase
VMKSGSYLLLADMMRSDAEYKEGIFSNCHLESELHTALIAAGFKLVKDEDISAAVAPTLDLCLDNFRTFGMTTFKYIADVVAIAVPPISAVGRWAYKRWLEQSIIEGLEARKIFDRHLCYKIQLWQLP